MSWKTNVLVVWVSDRDLEGLLYLPNIEEAQVIVSNRPNNNRKHKITIAIDREVDDEQYNNN